MRSYSRSSYRRTFLGLLLQLCLVVFAFTPTLSFGEQISQTSGSGCCDNFSTLFYRGLSDGLSQKYGEASSSFGTLMEQGKKRGFQNFPVFSQILLKQAHELKSDYPTSALFFLRQALLLSPSSASIQLSVCSFRDVLSPDEIIVHLKSGILSLPQDVMAVAAVGRNLLFILLCSLTLSLFVGCVIQLCANREILLDITQKLLPITKRGLLAPFILLLTLSLPLFGGLLFAISAWALLLVIFIPPCKKIGYLTATAVFLWALSLPVLQRLSLTHNSDILQFISVGRSNGYIDNSERIFRYLTPEQKQEPTVILSEAQYKFQKGDLAESGTLYDRFISLNATSPMLNAALINRALVALTEKDPKLAMSQLTRAELGRSRSLSLYVAFSELMMASSDIKQHDLYYQKALSKNRSWVYENQDLYKENLAVAIESLPFTSVFEALLSRAFEPNLLDRSDHSTQQGVLSSLITMGSLPSLYALAIVCFVVEWLTARRRTKRRSGKIIKEAGIEIISWVWLLLPGGVFLRGIHPARGIALFTLFIVIIMIYLDAPVSQISILTIPTTYSIWPIFAFWALITVVAALARYKQLAEIKR